MSNLSVFAFEGQDVRFVGTPEKPEWIAADVCNILSIAEAKSSLRDFDADEKGVRTMHTPGGNQELLTVTEAGLYRLIFKSRKPVAKKFQRWIFHEVLPAIRKTGAYSVAPTSSSIQITPAMLQAISTTTPEQAKAHARLSELTLARQGFELMTDMKVVERPDLLKLKERVMYLVMSDTPLPTPAPTEPEKAEYSISDRCKELGYTVDQRKLMTIGKRAATFYKARHRTLPPKKEDWVAVNVYKKDDLDLLDRAIKAVVG